MITIEIKDSPLHSKDLINDSVENLSVQMFQRLQREGGPSVRGCIPDCGNVLFLHG